MVGEQCNTLNWFLVCWQYLLMSGVEVTIQSNLGELLNLKHLVVIVTLKLRLIYRCIGDL